MQARPILRERDPGDSLRAEPREDSDTQLARAKLSELVGLLLETMKPAAFILTRRGQITASNAAGRALLEAGGRALRSIVCNVQDAAATEDAFIEPAGALRIRRRVFALEAEAAHLFVTAEPLAASVDAMTMAAKAHWRLTPRQAEVLHGVLNGLSNKEIAEQVNASFRTVEVHVSALFDKAGVDSRTRLIARAHNLPQVGHLGEEEGGERDRIR